MSGFLDTECQSNAKADRTTFNGNILPPRSARPWLIGVKRSRNASELTGDICRCSKGLYRVEGKC